MDNKKIMITIVILIVVGMLGYYFYKRGLTADLSKAGGTGNGELDKEDAAFVKKFWSEFTKRAGETPTWVLDSAVKKTMGEEDTSGLDSFYRANGALLKSGALFATIQGGYIPYGFSKVTAQGWQELWDLYTGWKTGINLKYA